jgi:hypothetical protein
MSLLLKKHFTLIHKERLNDEKVTYTGISPSI